MECLMVIFHKMPEVEPFLWQQFWNELLHVGFFDFLNNVTNILWKREGTIFPANGINELLDKHAITCTCTLVNFQGVSKNVEIFSRRGYRPYIEKIKKVNFELFQTPCIIGKEIYDTKVHLINYLSFSFVHLSVSLYSRLFFFAIILWKSNNEMQTKECRKACCFNTSDFALIEMIQM